MADSLQDTSILITGATAGIGALAASALAESGARLYVHGRDPEKLARAVSDLSRHSRAAVGGFVADLASLEDTARLARDVAREVPHLDVLINNAGVGFGRDRRVRELSRDGYELRFAVNYLAPFLLTERLLGAGLPRRAVINVASIGQEPLDFGDLMSEHEYSGLRAYRRSKLALVSWSFDLARRHPTLGVAVLHPGTLLDTAMVREGGIEPRGPASVGATAILHAVRHVLGGGESGLYFDVETPAPANARAYDLSAQAELRRVSTELTRAWSEA
jgi:NAD(P)-dependent dehydrogenase (short-subunit alcohol dehydrogenase family)